MAHVQTSLRLPRELVERADAIAADATLRDILSMRPTRSDILRTAIMRGLAVLTEEIEGFERVLADED